MANQTKEVDEVSKILEWLTDKFNKSRACGSCNLGITESKKPQKLKAPRPQRSENAKISKKARKKKKNNYRYWRGHRALKNGRL